MKADRALERARLLCIKAGLDPEGLQRMESDQGPCFVTADFKYGLIPGYDEFLVMSTGFVSMKDLANRRLPQSSYTVRTNDAFEFDRREPTASHAVDGTINPQVTRRLLRSVENFTLRQTILPYPTDYSKVPPEQFGPTPNEVGLMRIESFIRNNPHLGNQGLYKALMEARGFDVPYQVANVPITNPSGCPTCGHEGPEPDLSEPENRRMIRSEWLVWYAFKHNLGLTAAWEAAAKKVIELEFGEKSRWRVTAYPDPHDPRLVRIKYNDN